MKNKDEMKTDLELLLNFLTHGKRESLLQCEPEKLRKINRLFQSIASPDDFEKEFPHELLERYHRNFVKKSLIPKCIQKATDITKSAKIDDPHNLPIPELSRVAYLELIETLMRPEIINTWTAQQLLPKQKCLIDSLKSS